MRWMPLVALLASCEVEQEIDCKEAPLVTYETFGRGFLTQHCQPCHSSESIDRNEAPDDVTFDTIDDVAFWQYDIVDLATGGNPQMPPQGGVSDDDRVLLAIWLECYGVEAED